MVTSFKKACDYNASGLSISYKISDLKLEITTITNPMFTLKL